MMLNTPHIDWFALATILVLLGASFVSLLGAVLVRAPSRRRSRAIVSSLGFLGGLVASIWLYVDSAARPHGRLGRLLPRPLDRARADHPLRRRPRDDARLAGSTSRLERGDPTRDDHIAEFFALLLASAAGMAFFVGSANLMVLFLSLEWFSIALYVMCAIDYDLEGSLEAGLKYLDRRLVRLGRAPLRLGARVRRDGADLVRRHRLGDRRRRA